MNRTSTEPRLSLVPPTSHDEPTVPMGHGADEGTETRFTVEAGWLVETVDEHTCGTGSSGHYGAHEPGCGLVPVATMSDVLAGLALLDAARQSAVATNTGTETSTGTGTGTGTVDGLDSGFGFDSALGETSEWVEFTTVQMSDSAPGGPHRIHLGARQADGGVGNNICGMDRHARTPSGGYRYGFSVGGGWRDPAAHACPGCARAAAQRPDLRVHGLFSGLFGSPDVARGAAVPTLR